MFNTPAPQAGSTALSIHFRHFSKRSFTELSLNLKQYFGVSLMIKKVQTPSGNFAFHITNTASTVSILISSDVFSDTKFKLVTRDFAMAFVQYNYVIDLIAETFEPTMPLVSFLNRLSTITQGTLRNWNIQ
ncbi:hypothetical protein H7R52_11155 [Weissella confusa]|uniref:Uncharacterized protein n=1 Tax=Weissella confusa TaxID=1583 RepID=A0A923SNQ7_WEICO|nr:hypothetical protein [Weissella confusa]